jgi:hypothetical protein
MNTQSQHRLDFREPPFSLTTLSCLPGSCKIPSRHPRTSRSLDGGLYDRHHWFSRGLITSSTGQAVSSRGAIGEELEYIKVVPFFDVLARRRQSPDGIVIGFIFGQMRRG